MNSETWLITGGAGYIGSHIADLFLAKGKSVVVLDSFLRGQASRINYLDQKYGRSIPVITSDIRDVSTFDEVLQKYKPHGIVHTSALKSVGESIEKPEEYFEVNFNATRNIIDLAASHGIKNFIFSSTAAVYGVPTQSDPVKEDHPKHPISPYGASKLAAETEVEKFLKIPGNRGTSLRFFNVVGTANEQLSDNSVDNLVPIVLNKLKGGFSPIIFGSDYPTIDGTCVRDYIDVRDIALAHYLAAEFQSNLPMAMNVGSGEGYTVSQVIELISIACGLPRVTPIKVNRRPGDPAFLSADTKLIQKTLNFEPHFSIQQSINSLFN